MAKAKTATEAPNGQPPRPTRRAQEQGAGRWRVELPHVPAAEGDALSRGDAIEKYKQEMGIISTDHQFSAVRVGPETGDPMKMIKPEPKPEEGSDDGDGLGEPDHVA